MMKGLPGSGKSTYAKSLADKGYIRVNKDDLRAMLNNGKWSKNNEKFVVELRDGIIDMALEDGRNVVVDDTNFEAKHQLVISRIAKDHGAAFEEKFIDTPVEVCIERDLKRLNSVGEKVIRDMYNRHLRIIEKPKAADKDCVVFDIDGTLAHMNGRSPYDETLVKEDRVDEEIQSLNIMVDIARKALNSDLSIIIMSGRHESCKEDTEAWLFKNGIQYDQIYMRPTDDDRSDTIIKQELYEKHINGKYRVWAWFDDRDRVVKAMRDKGIKVLQVAEGDF